MIDRMLDGNVDVLEGKPEKALVTLAIPILIYLFISNSYNIIDGMWISGIGKAAITGVGSVTPLFNVVNGVGMGIGAGATSASDGTASFNFTLTCRYTNPWASLTDAEEE